MSIVHMDGFDSYTTAADVQSEYILNNNNSFSTSAGRYGGGGVAYGSLGNGFVFRLLSSALTELWSGYAINATGFSSSFSTIFQVGGAAGVEFSVTYYNGTIKVYRGTSSNTLVGTYSGTISTGSWHWLEFRYKYHASAGVCEVWCDGVQLATYSGNTTFNSSGSINGHSVGNYWGGWGLTGTIDDLYILDATTGANTTRLGDSRIETLVPTGNGATNNGTASTGSNYTCVDEAQYNTSDYVTITGASGQEELYTIGALSSSAYVVSGVRMMAIDQKLDAGPSFLKMVAVSSGSEVDSAGIPTLTSWARQYAILDSDPHTSAAWTAAAVNAAQYGVKVA